MKKKILYTKSPMRKYRMDLIKNIKNDDLITAKATFKDIMSAKVIDKLNQMKKEVGANLYQQKQEDK